MLGPGHTRWLPMAEGLALPCTLADFAGPEQKNSRAFGLRRPHQSLGTVLDCLEHRAWLPLQNLAACSCWGMWLVVANRKAVGLNDNWDHAIATHLAILPSYTSFLFHMRLAARGFKGGEWFHPLSDDILSEHDLPIVSS